MTLPEAMAMGRAWKKVPPLPLLLNGVVNALTGRTESVEDEKEAPVDPAVQAGYDKWMADHLDKVQASGGMVSNMVIQAQGE